MNEVSVTIAFPTEELARRFLAWLSDGSGEQDFMDAVKEWLGFDYDMDKFFCRVTVD